jgi:hypothetical protein
LYRLRRETLLQKTQIRAAGIVDARSIVFDGKRL